MFRPIAAALNLEPDHLDTITDPVVGPQSHVLKLKTDDQKALFSHLLLAFNCTYQLQLGMRYRLQIDIPLRRLKDSIESLRNCIHESTAATNLAFLSGILGTYQMHSVGSLQLADSAATDAQLLNFDEFVHDETYRQYSAARHDLGYRTRVATSIDRIWQLSRDSCPTAASEKFSAMQRTWCLRA
jgi:hypothetical protein